MNYKLFLSFVIVLVTTVGLLNWPYWEATLLRQQLTPTLNQTPTENYTLAIPAIKITAPIIFPISKREEDIQQALHEGVAHYPGTALPGQAGNVYLVGHSSDYPWAKGDYKRVLARLAELKAGDEIKLSDSSGQSFTYEVIETKIVSPTDLSVLSQPPDQKLLTLQTSHAIGTALKRYIVRAKLVE